MAFPLMAVSTGLSLLGGLNGLLQGASAQRRAEEAQALAIRDLRASGEQEYSDALGSGQQGLYGLRGQLGDALVAGGRNLGASMAAAGVTNSSATAGALARQSGEDASTIGRYTSGLAQMLARIRNSTNRDVAGLKYGMAGNNLNFARQQTAAGAGGMASFLGNLGQMNLSGQGVNAYKPNNTGSVLGMPAIPGNSLPWGAQPVGDLEMQMPRFKANPYGLGAGQAVA